MTVGVLVFASLLLVSCASGDVDESRQFQAQEGERTQQVPQAQQTEIARQFLKPTGTPVATFTPIALLSELVIASSVNSSGAPSDDLERISASAPSVSVAAQISNLSPDQVVRVEWLNDDGGIIWSEEKVAGAGGGQWISFTLPLAGSIPPGTYAAAIRVNGDLLNSIVFQIG